LDPRDRARRLHRRDEAAARREDARALCSGPGKSARRSAFRERRMRGVRGAAVSLFAARFERKSSRRADRDHESGDTALRYGLKGSKFLSKPFNDPHARENRSKA